MGTQDPGRYITRPSVIILFLICVLIYYAISNGDNSGESGEEEPEQRKSQPRRKEKAWDTWETEEPEPPAKPIRQSRATESTLGDSNELVLGSKKYKLYEKKRLNFKKAEAFCKKHDGKLARTENVDEMQRLQGLLAKARMVSDEMWIGVDKKQWKKHAWKMQQHPGGINPEALSGMNAMMMGGGRQEMCPALSSSTRALAPAMCMRELPFICEFDKEPKPKPTNQKKVDRKPGKTSKMDKANQRRVKSTMKPKMHKMKRRRREEM